MPTKMPRISTVVEPPLYEAIAHLAETDGVSLSQKTRDLLLEAVELVEDAVLEALVERRRRNRRPSIPLAEVKRRLKLR